MNAIETILSRKSIPLMEDPKPSKGQLKKIYKAGLRAPDHGGLNPWKFIEVSGKDRLKPVSYTHLTLPTTPYV